MLPNPHVLIRPFLRREAVSSSRIEGTVTDLEQLLFFEADPTEGPQAPDHQEVVNYVRALEYGLARLATLPVSLRLIREVHEHLMTGVRGEDRMPGAFRTRQNMIARTGQAPAEARFVPPPADEMLGALNELERFIGQPGKLPVLIELALIHYQFEAIHPFMDGNGRLGRLLISLLLCERGCLTQPLLYLSDYLEKNGEAYMDRLLAVSQRGAWSDWIGFFLEGIAVQSKTAVERCNRLLALWTRYKDAVRVLGPSSISLQLVDRLFETPALTITQAKEALGVTFRAAQLNIEKLVRVGILREVTGMARHRIYAAAEIINILEGPEERAGG